MNNFGRTRPAVNAISFENTLNSFSLSQLRLSNGSVRDTTNRYSRNVVNERKAESYRAVPPPVLRRSNNANSNNNEQYHFSVATKSVESKQRIEVEDDRRSNEEPLRRNRIEEREVLKPKQVNEDNFTRQPPPPPQQVVRKPREAEIVIDNEEEEEEEEEEDIEEEELEQKQNKNALVIPDVASSTVDTYLMRPSDFQLEFERSLNESVSTLNHVLMPISADCMMKCTIKRNSKRLPTYTMYLEKHDGNYQKLLIAHTVRKLPSTYMKIYAVKISNESSKRNLVLLGKLKANIATNQFTLVGLLNASDTLFEDSDDDTSSQSLREEHMTISYKDISIFSANKVQKFTFFVPRERKLTSVRNSVSRFSSSTSAAAANDNFLARYSSTHDNTTTEFISKLPKYNEKKGTYTLNFNGRVSETSAHNCQAIAKHRQAGIMFQLGKIGKNTFICDFTSPLTSFQAFGVAISNLCR